MSAARDVQAAAEPGFAPDGDGARWTYAGELTSANAGTVLGAAGALRLPGDGEVDLTDVEGIDSAAVAVLLLSNGARPTRAGRCGSSASPRRSPPSPNCTVSRRSFAGDRGAGR